MSLILRRLQPLATVLVRNGAKLPKQQPISRNAGGTILYRMPVMKDSAVYYYLGEGLSFFLWYWVLYHAYYDFHHIVPDHIYPDTTKFTDAELGIPPDDEE